MRCGAYARFSSDLQHPSSIDDQLSACLRYAGQHKWELLSEYIFKDEALSGVGIEHRPGYCCLLNVVSSPAPPFEILLVDDLSRLSRDTAEILRLARLLQTQGIRLVSVADGIETGTKVSKLVLSIKAIMNEAYLDDLRDRTLRGLQGRFERNLHTGGRIFGYQSVPVVDPSGRMDATGQPLLLGAKLIIEEAEAQIVQQIFTWFAEGVSLRAIADRLNVDQKPFPSKGTVRGLKRKGWAGSAVRVILKNEKYIGRWTYGRRIFTKDPLTGKRRARLRPSSEWQVTDCPELRIISEALWGEVEARFAELGTRYWPRGTQGRLAGRKAGGVTPGQASLCSGLLQCGICGGALIAVSGSLSQGTQRYGCGFHRNKGSRVCLNGLTVKTRVLEERLIGALHEHLWHPKALAYLTKAVNRRLETLWASQKRPTEALKKELQQVEQALRNIEKAILAGIVGETTGELLKNYEGKRKALQAKLALPSQNAKQPLRINSTIIKTKLKGLHALLNTDPPRVNTFLRKHLAPIVCTPKKENGQRFYRARGVAREDQLLTFLGIETSFDFRGCGGGI